MRGLLDTDREIPAPSLAAGVATGWRYRRLVLVLAAVQALVAVPLAWRLAEVATAVRAAAAVGFTELAVVTVEAGLGAGEPAVAVAMVTVVLWWVFSVVWQAGMVVHRVWSTESTAHALTVLGHGLLRLGPFVRLELVAGVVVAGGAGLLWVGVALLVVVSGPAVTVVGLTLGCLATGALKVVVAAVLRGASWRLGRPGCRGTWVAIRDGAAVLSQRPFRVLAVVLGWTVPAALAATAVPVVLWLVATDSQVAATGVAGGAVLLHATCRLGLAASFEPMLDLPTPDGGGRGLRRSTRG